MRFATFHLTSCVGSSSPVGMVPGADLSDTQSAGRSDGVTLGGRLVTYLVGGRTRQWTVPLFFVSSGTKAELTAWWRDQRPLAFTVNMSSNPQTCLARIVNAQEPFPSNAAGRPDLFNGGLILREIQGSDPGSGMPFITDDPLLGLTDQTINPTP